MSTLTREPLAQYPLHRDKYLSLETPVNGVGCYVQLCEARLTKYIDKAHKLHDHLVPDSEPFLDKFIHDIYQPLLRSDCKMIVINIDPLSKNSDETLLIDTAKRLLSLDTSAKIKIDRTRDDIYIRSTDRVNIIIPDEHINGCVGRNISFWFIRSTLYDNGLYWFGSDDDDKIDQDGVNSLSYFISHYIDPYDHSKVILFDDRYMNKLKQPEQGYTRYAPWSYAFSPEYYDGISFPCCPLEKEDLDVFNRFMQHPECIVNVFSHMKKDEFPAVYEYAGPGDRPKDHRLYHTKDVIAYMNAHNDIESTEIAKRAPLSTPQKEVPRKSYFMNESERYYVQNEEIRRNKGAYYGIANIGDDSTSKDQLPDHKLSELVATAAPSQGVSSVTEEFNDNFNGDLYIVSFKVYNKSYRRLYGACFQNGKLPEILPVKEYAHYTPTENEKSIHQELTQIIPDYADIFYARTTKPSAKEYRQIKTWNEDYLQKNRTPDQWIPLKTFGGSNDSHRWVLWIIVILIIALIVYICVPFNRNAAMRTMVDSDRIIH